MIKKANSLDLTSITGDIVPATDFGSDLGSNAKHFGNIYGSVLILNSGVIYDAAGNPRFEAPYNDATTYRGITNGTSTPHKFINYVALTGGNIADFYNDNGTTLKAHIDVDGQFENATAGKGIILKSPDGTRYLVTVTNAGAIQVSAA